MGINLEDKDVPRFNYNVSIAESTEVEYDGDEEGREEWEENRKLAKLASGYDSDDITQL